VLSQNATAVRCHVVLDMTDDAVHSKRAPQHHHLRTTISATTTSVADDAEMYIDRQLTHRRTDSSSSSSRRSSPNTAAHTNSNSNSNRNSNTKRAALDSTADYTDNSNSNSNSTSNNRVRELSLSQEYRSDTDAELSIRFDDTANSRTASAPATAAAGELASTRRLSWHENSEAVTSHNQTDNSSSGTAAGAASAMQRTQNSSAYTNGSGTPTSASGKQANSSSNNSNNNNKPIKGARPGEAIGGAMKPSIIDPATVPFGSEVILQYYCTYYVLRPSYNVYLPVCIHLFAWFVRAYYAFMMARLDVCCSMVTHCYYCYCIMYCVL
jgi:hypothetical protein